jgi:ubiquinone biosynthesis accessory factor UbiJ
VFLAIAMANGALEREHWARARLAAHAGRAVRVQIGLASQAFAIDADGWLHASEAAPDLKLTIPVLRLPALLAQPERWSDWVAAEGDAALAATLRELALTLPWFVEELCAKAFGPVAGQRLADLGRRLLALPGYAAGRFTDSVASYVGNDAHFAAGAAEARVVAGEITALAARVDALAQRIDALARSTSPAPPGPPPRQGGGRARRNSG